MSAPRNTSTWRKLATIQSGRAIDVTITTHAFGLATGTWAVTSLTRFIWTCPTCTSPWPTRATYRPSPPQTQSFCPDNTAAPYWPSSDHLPLKNLSRSRVTSRSSSLTPDVHLEGPRNLPSNASSRCSTRTSQPSSQSTNQNHTEDFLQSKKNNWSTLIVNRNGAAGKRTELAQLFETTQPDAVIFCETKLNPIIKCAEFVPLGFNCFRKDRTSSRGGGVMIVVKSNYPVVDIEIEVDCEVVWISVSTRNNRKVYLGSFYRPPDKGRNLLMNLRSPSLTLTWQLETTQMP